MINNGALYAMIKVIGIDPGLASTGIGVVRGEGFDIAGYSFGAINTPKDISSAARLDIIFSKVFQVLEDEKPDLMVVEDAFSLGKYPKAGISLGKVSGVVLLAGYRNGINVIEVSVRETKQVVTGNGNAGKAQLERSVRQLINHSDPIKPDHASDAIALALVGLFRYENFINSD